MFDFLKPKASIRSKSGHLALVNAKGRVLTTSSSSAALRTWAVNHGYRLALGNGMDKTAYPTYPKRKRK